MRALAIGASAEHEEGIRVAQLLGFEVLALDGNPCSPGFKVADQYTCVNLADKEAALQLARQFRPQIVIPAPLGTPLITAGFINDSLGLKGVSEYGGRIANDKQAMRVAFTAKNVQMAKQRKISNVTDLRLASEELGLPLILKPSCGSGSKGVRLLERRSDFPARLEPLIDDSWIVEEALKGNELGIDGIVIRGDVHILCIRKKRMTEPPYRQELSYQAIDPLTYSLTHRIKEVVTSCLSAMRCDNCFFNADVMEVDAEAWVIEFAPRPGGNNIFTHLLTRVFEQDLIGWYLRSQLIGASTVIPAFLNTTYFEYLPVPIGTVSRVGDFSSIKGGEARVEVRTPLLPGYRLSHIMDSKSAMERGWVMCSPISSLDGQKIALECARMIEMERNS